MSTELTLIAELGRIPAVLDAAADRIEELEAERDIARRLADEFAEIVDSYTGESHARDRIADCLGLVEDTL